MRVAHTKDSFLFSKVKKSNSIGSESKEKYWNWENILQFFGFCVVAVAKKKTLFVVVVLESDLFDDDDDDVAGLLDSDDDKKDKVTKKSCGYGRNLRAMVEK